MKFTEFTVLRKFGKFTEFTEFTALRPEPGPSNLGIYEFTALRASPGKQRNLRIYGFTVLPRAWVKSAP